MRAPASPPTLVVLRALGLGDLLTAVPSLRALAEAFPDHDRVLAAPGRLAPLLELIPEYRSSAFRVIHVAELGPLPGELFDPDTAVNLHGRGPLSHRVLRALHPRRLISFRDEDCPSEGSWSREGPDWREGEHEVVRWCRMLAESGIPADPRRLGLAAPDVPVAPRASGATVVHPGASSAARRWPAERWARVARAEMERGHRVMVTGDAEERALAMRVARFAGLGTDAVLAGRTGPKQLAAVVAAAARVACGDTGVAHLATAFGTPSVVLFGPTSPGEWGPPAGGRHRALWAGRLGDPHGAAPDAGLLAISPGEVIRGLRELPGRLNAQTVALSSR